MELKEIVAKVSAYALGEAGIFVECVKENIGDSITVGSPYKVIERYKNLICIRDDRGSMADVSPHLFRKISQ